MDSISDEIHIGEKNMKIAFIVGGFPSILKTFILNQITGLIGRGHDVEIFAITNPKNKKVHSIIKI
jgi:colanic acid/amylovoran biosynthesis glycosyltransferase